MLKLTTLASGSKGNSVYVGTDNTKILIDAGLSGKKLSEALSDINVALEDIDAVFVTHEHSDHINGVGVLSRKYNIPIYATKGTWDNMQKKIGEISPNNKNVLCENEKVILNDMCIKPFSVPHDAKEPVCYSVIYDGKKICVATDMGHINKNILENIKDCSALVLESNHDEDMVKKGAYPYDLKKRILGKYGHISNEICGKVLSCVMNDKLKNVFLGHISQENNTPHLAFSTVCDVLNKFDITPQRDIHIHVAKPYGITELVEIK